MSTQILLIDEDPIINFVHSKRIGKRLSGVPIYIFEKASAGLNHIKSNPLDSFLVFLDISTPEMNAWEFLDAIELEAEGLDIQVHIVTTTDDPADRLEAKKHRHVSSFLVKPLIEKDLDQLLT